MAQGKEDSGARVKRALGHGAEMAAVCRDIKAQKSSVARGEIVRLAADRLLFTCAQAAAHLLVHFLNHLLPPSLRPYALRALFPPPLARGPT